METTNTEPSAPEIEYIRQEIPGVFVRITDESLREHNAPILIPVVEVTSDV